MRRREGGIRAVVEGGFYASLLTALNLMSEMPVAGKYHGNAMFVRSSNHFSILYAAPRLNHGFRPGRGQHVEPVPEREEGI